MEFGTLTGYIPGAGFLTVLTFVLPASAMESWGWRLPFLFALPMGLIGIVILLNVADYTLLTYMPTYLSRVLRMTQAMSLLIVVGVILMMTAVITVVGALSDRVGRKPVLLASALCFALFSYPAFWLISRGTIASTIVGVLLLGIFLVLYLGTEPSTLPAIFPTPIGMAGSRSATTSRRRSSAGQRPSSTRT